MKKSLVLLSARKPSFSEHKKSGRLNKNGTIIKGNVISKTKGGLIVDCNGPETFLSRRSRIDIKPIVDAMHMSAR
ncbi:MAG: hypothetical protein U0T81_04495 [Saprospiraceae bacterium]